MLALGAAPSAWSVGTYGGAVQLIPDDQPVTGSQVQKPLYKPHEIAFRGGATPIWITSNERTGKAGISIFKSPNNELFATMNIDEPGAQFAQEQPETATTVPETPESPVKDNFPAAQRVAPKVCLPVLLPPGSQVPTVDGLPVATWPTDAHYVCAPLGAEMHARHPHGIDIDAVRNRAYQVIEHSGLKWNAQRTGFVGATNADEEAGMLVIYDIVNPKTPKIVGGALLGHGAHEVAVNNRNGRVFVGNHEDNPGVTPNVWVSVIDTTWANPYGFIDTGWTNAVQGIEVDPVLNLAYGTTHVGEKMIAMNANCTPTLNSAPNDEKQMGKNCIKYSVDLRAPFVAQVAGATELLARAQSFATEGCYPAVLHTHDLTVDSTRHLVYITVHGIHEGEHTGLPEETACAIAKAQATQAEEAAAAAAGTTATEAAELGADVQGRWVAVIDVNPQSANFKKVTYIDLSNGMDAMTIPTIGEVPKGTPFNKQFVHAHWVAVDAQRQTLLVTGEHTGNMAVVDSATGKISRVFNISTLMAGAKAGEEEPEVHGVQVDATSGRVYVSEEGELNHYYEGVTILKVTK
jgi:DNA-binding beta-propeller fold protein YncE